MKIIYARQPLPRRGKDGVVPNSIFLVGPTPRKEGHASWRPAALKHLEQLGFTGTVFVPEDADWGVHGDYDHQVWWEVEALGRSAVILAWVPRKLRIMPALTTNTEIGFVLALRPERLLIGGPPNARKLRYQLTLASDVNRFRRAFGLPSVGIQRQPYVVWPVKGQRGVLRHLLSVAIQKAAT